MKYFLEDDNALKAVFIFPDFLAAVDFVNQVADIAMQLEHHPDILLHDYNNVTVTTTTHDEGNTITDKDKELAKQVEELV